ncbi:haloacid dehalogenase type II [Limibacter armeniacum]|uniref:haloacid dehalogenase type II n=1 Tax=Limibacter armeniacum TaxID=466084 RepID=UPI002FE65793
MSKPRVLFFDVNETLLDLQKVKESVTKTLNGRAELVPLWFTTMLQYSLVNTVSDRFEDFGSIGVAALQMVAADHGILLSKKEASESVAPIVKLTPYEDSAEGLKLLKDAGFTLCALTNSSTEGLKKQMDYSGLGQYFDHLLSVEEVGYYKPHSHVYRWAMRKVRVAPEASMMIAAHGWDVAGAMWAGMRAAFVARPQHQLYPLSQPTEIVAGDILKVAEKIINLE